MTTPGWRDPRLWVGVAIVAACVVAGARLLAAADDTVAVWAVSSDLGPGDQVTADDLVSERVRFADDADLDRYFTVDDELPADLELDPRRGGGRTPAPRRDRLAPAPAAPSRCGSRSTTNRCRRR